MQMQLFIGASIDVQHRSEYLQCLLTMSIAENAVFNLQNLGVVDTKTTATKG